MQGILIVDKPAGFTSFDVVAKLRGICKTRKIGHSGTLDPMATGVLPVFIGAAAKAVDLQENTDKAYDAQLLLGLRTDTGDITGRVLETAPVPQHVNEAAVRSVLARFTGPQMQLPPMYSAVKVNGQPLYKAARRGEVVERKARPVVIYSIEYRGFVPPATHLLHVACGKGTYIRTLAEDIGAALGVPASLAALRRTAAGPYTEAQALTLEEIQRACDDGTLPQRLLSVETVFAAWPALCADAAAVQRLCNGAPVYGTGAADGRYRISGPDGFLGVGTVDGGVLCAQKLFLERN